MKWLILACIATQATDTATTVYNLRTRPTFVETNGLLPRTPGRIAATKAGITFTLAWGATKMPKPLGVTLLGACTFSGTRYTVSNLKRGR